MRTHLQPRAPRHVWTCVQEAVPIEFTDDHRRRRKYFAGGAWTLFRGLRTKMNNWSVQVNGGLAPCDLWQTLRESLPPSGSVWLMVPDLSEWMILSQAWSELTAGQLWIPGITTPRATDDFDPAAESWKLPGYLAIGGSTEVFCGRLLSRSISILGAGNYHTGSVPELLAGLGSDDLARFAVHNEDGRYRTDRGRIASVIHNWITRLIKSWTVRGVGPWRHSASQLAHSACRKVQRSRAYIPTDRPEIRILERDGCFGGRAEVWHAGYHVDETKLPISVPPLVWRDRREFVPSAVHRFDIRSCYPSIVGGGRAPEKLVDVWNGRGDASAVILDRNACQLAYCRIVTDEPCYPCRVQHDRMPTVPMPSIWPMPRRLTHRWRTIFPTGEFSTTLCGDELQHAARYGRIAEIHHLTTYATTSAFCGWMQDVYAQRLACEASGDSVGADLCKMLANSFLGKFAAHSPKWSINYDVGAPEFWCTWIQHDLDHGVMRKFRSLGKVVQECTERQDNPRSHPILFGWATSRARMMLRTYMLIAGHKNIIQVDTDGMYVNDDGARALASRGIGIKGASWGELRLVSKHAAARFWGPKHYWIENGGWTMAGVPDGFTLVDGDPQTAFQADYSPMPSLDAKQHAGTVRGFAVVPTYSGGRRPCADVFGATEALLMPGWDVPVTVPDDTVD